MGSGKSIAVGIIALLVWYGPVFAQNALSFDGSNDEISFGDASQTPELGLAEFTVEFWFQRTGTGQTANTGNGGFVGIPLVTKGRGEAEDSNLDMNYFVGIRDSDDVIAADFEEAGTGPEPGLNHPVFGSTTISNGVWYHVAATYDGTDWTLYLDGQVDGSSNVGREPRSDSIQHFGVGTAYNSSGTAAGRFQGNIDEVRVWDRALTQSEILSGIKAEIASTNGLVGRWGLNEGVGTTAGDSSGNANDGTISGAAWVSGAPFDINLPPDAATVVMPANGAEGIGVNPTLEVTVTDPEADTMDVAFFGRQVDGVASQNFTVVALPDTQFYSCGASCAQNGDPATFSAQTQWALDQLSTLNVAFVTQLGDCVQNGDNGGDDSEWLVASNAFAIIEDPVTTMLTDGIPFGIAVGNHDQSPIADPDGTTTFYNQYFGEAHFAGRAYYGGHFGSNNDNSYQLFTAGGIDFIILHLEYDTTPDAVVLTWADNLLQTHSNRKAMVTAHWLLNANGSFSAQGQAVYDALKANSNLFLMMCGHVTSEAQRSDVFNGNEVHTLLSDYQNRANGGNGWLRYLQFDVQNNTIDVKTYSPTLDQHETDFDSEFTLTFSGGGFATEFQQIGSTQLGVASGNNASVVWPALPVSETFEWFVEVSDATGTTTSTTWSFTTACTDDVDCNDANTCTNDACNTNGICEYTNTNGFCDDGNACTNDACSNGVCESTPNTDPCDDGDLCTEFDACSGGACAGTPVSCDPGDVCNPSDGLCATPVTVSFQQGTSSYSGNIDTYLADDATTTDFSGSTTLIVDLVSENHILMRFEEIYGIGPGQIPPGATIQSADLTINVTNSSPGVGATLHRMLQPWNDTDTWEFWGGGIQSDDIEAASAVDASGSSGVGVHVLDVSTSIETWLANPSTNLGWAWLPPAQDNSWQFDSAEAATVSNRPLLEVTYLPMACTSGLDCDDSNPCTDDSCNAGQCDNTPNTDPCDDGDACTTGDACAAGTCGGTPISCTGDDVCDPNIGQCVTPVMVMFQEETGVYEGTVDTEIRGATPNTDASESTQFRFDTSSGGGPNIGLLRFEEIFVSNGGLIPDGATITSATVTITIHDAGDPGNLHEVLVDWVESVTFNTFGGEPDVQADEYNNTSLGTVPGSIATHDLDVTSSLQGWSADPGSNRGWVFLATASGGVGIRSSEWTTQSERPKLTVEYLPITCGDSSECDDLDDCTDDVCNNGVCTNDPIPNCCIDAGDCDDAEPCTTDTCELEQCVFTPIPDCCASDDDCDDGTACTIDRCNPGNAAALTFDGVNDQVTMGPATDLSTATFTVECWFRQTGAGDTVSTGNGGLTGGDVAIPLVTKGRGEAEGDNRDMNYFLGIHAANGTLAADFEEHSSGTTPGQNHPVIADTAIGDTDWHHAAVTYDGSCWQIYLDGVDDNAAVNCPNEPPNFISIQHFALGTAQNSSGSADGRLEGTLDEVRVWDHARTPAEIADGMGRQIVSSNGLIGRWGLNEGAGDYAFDSTLTGTAGTISGASWETANIVDFGGGVCENSPIADCCTSGLECDDGNSCTTDECVPASISALSFDGSDDEVTMGQAPQLGASQFTLEAWIKPTGAGATASTGGGGVVAVPLVAKGRGEADGNNRDANYFMGIDGSSDVLVADFESVDPSPNNFPVSGTTPISTLDVWYHVAATYDGATWRLYLNGVLDGSNTVNRTPRFDSIQHFSLGTAQTSTGASSGRFEGLMDEVRVWNYARTEAAIQSTMSIEIDSAPGLIGRWGLNETSGVTATDSAGNANDGTIDGATYVTSNGLLIGFNDCVNDPIPGCCDEAADCDDANLCTIDICSNAVCENEPVDCSHLDDTCNVGVCNPGDGMCEVAPVNEGGACDDLDACTVSDACTNGVCAGTFEDCDGDGVCDADDNCPTVVNAGQDPAACNGPFDFDNDGDVDLDDFAIVAACLDGPDELTPPGGCSPGDFADADQDSDGDVDLDDFALLQLEFTGMIVSPCE